MKRIAAAFLGIVLLLGSQGCAREDSCAVLTSAIHVTFNVFEQGDEARVVARFQVGHALGTLLELGDCGDVVFCNGVPLQLKPLIVQYEAVLEKSEVYVFTFDRGDAESHTSVVNGLPPVIIASPSAGEEFSIAEDITVEWEANFPDSPGVGVELFGDCIWHFLDTVDDGEHTIGGGTLSFDIDPETGEVINGCSAGLSVYRAADGELAPGLKGVIRLENKDRVTVTLTE